MINPKKGVWAQVRVPILALPPSVSLPCSLLPAPVAAGFSERLRQWEVLGGAQEAGGMGGGKPGLGPALLCSPQGLLHGSPPFCSTGPASSTSRILAPASWLPPLDSSNPASSLCSFQVRGSQSFPTITNSLVWLFSSFQHLWNEWPAFKILQMLCFLDWTFTYRWLYTSIPKHL